MTDRLTQGPPPTWRESVTYRLRDLVGYGMAKTLMDAADYTPLGAVFASNEAGAKLRDGRKGAAALGLGGALLAGLPLPAAKVSGKVARAAKKALAMDEASRMARAAEQGFTVDAYHGTTSNFDAFDPTRTRDIGMHFGTPEQAGKITQNWNGHQMTDANIIPVKLAVNNPLRVADDFDRQSRRHIGIAKTITLETPGFMPNAAERDAIYAAAKNADKLKASARRKYAIMPSNLDVGEQAFWAEIQKSAERQGYDGLVYANKIEGKGDSHVVFDPANIRSKFAAFDPAKRKSANLLAGIGGAGIAVPLTIGQMSQQRQGGGI